MPFSRAFLYISFRVPSKAAPSPFQVFLTELSREICSVSRALLHQWLRVPGKRTHHPGSQCGPYGENCPFPEPSFTHPLIKEINFSLKVPGKGAHTMLPQQGPYGQSCSVSTANGYFIHLYLSESPVKELSHEMGENIRSPSTEHHADGMGCDRFPQGECLRHCYHYPSAMQPSARYLPLSLGWW